MHLRRRLAMELAVRLPEEAAATLEAQPFADVAAFIAALPEEIGERPFGLGDVTSASRARRASSA